MSNYINFTTKAARQLGTKTTCFSQHSLKNELLYFKSALYLIIIILSIIGNTAVLRIIYKVKSMRSVTNLLICNCAVADLIITLYPAVWEVLDSFIFKGTWPLGSFMCIFMYMCVYISVAATIITLVMITCERYCAVMIPHRKIITKIHLHFIIPVIWIVAFGFASPTIIAQKVVGTDNNEYFCMEKWSEPFYKENSPKHYTLVLFLFLYATPLCLMCVMYVIMAAQLYKSNTQVNNKLKRKLIKISYSVYRKEQNIAFNNSSVRSAAALSSRKKRVIKMLVAIVLVFAVCWLPVYCLQFLMFFNSFYIECPQAMSEWVYFMAFWMQYANAAANPMLYFYFSSSYRKGFQKTFPYFFKRTKQLAKTPGKNTKHTLA